MRILFLTHQYFPRHVGGTEMLVRGLARRLRERGDEAVVVTYVESASGHLPDHGFRVTEFEGVPVWELHWNLSVSSHPAEAEFHDPMIAELVARAAREIAPDVVHAAHVMKLSATVVPRLREQGLPVVVTLSDFWPLCLRHTLLKPDGTVCETGPDHAHRCLMCAQATHGFAMPERRCADEAALWDEAARCQGDSMPTDTAFGRDVLALARRNNTVREALMTANRLISLSDFQRGVLVQHGYAANRIEVLQHGVETEPLEEARAQRRQRASSTTPRQIVFIGTLAQHKGVHLLVEALRDLPDLPVSLQIYGSGGVDAAYVDRLRSLAAPDPRIAFRGVLPPEHLGEAFVHASALALPALWFENDPLVVKAALYCGVPVAATRIGSLSGLVREPEDGWLLPIGDVKAWGAWLRNLASADTLPTPSGDAIPIADAFANQMFLAYQDVAASSRRP
jgi:glycosyltransferase involved in cell wall biosynthesis